MQSSPPFTGRLAMWSGPRNISTALMRSFENRPDAIVVDEPFYGFYLAETGLDHPGRKEVVQTLQNDWREVALDITRPLPAGINVYYQKHMTHHMLPQVSLRWLNDVTSCFLIRDPREVINSYRKVRPNVTLEDIGFARQIELFELVRREIDPHPPVLDARDVLENPRGVLSHLCDRLDLPFHEEMLAWPPGPRESDGVWAKYWYAAVEKSTGFAPYRPRDEALPDHLTELWEAAQAIYERLAAYRLK